jgi:hypothetical protein
MNFTRFAAPDSSEIPPKASLRENLTMFVVFMLIFHFCYSDSFLGMDEAGAVMIAFLSMIPLFAEKTK